MLDLGSSPTYLGSDGRKRDAIAVFGQLTDTPSPAAPLIGRVTSPATFPDGALLNGVVIKALTTNSGPVELLTGAQTAGQGYPMAPGELVSLAISQLSSVRVVGTGALAYAAS